MSLKNFRQIRIIRCCIIDHVFKCRKDDRLARSKRELDAEAVAYIVGRYFGLDTSGSAFYLAAWQGEGPGAIADRPDFSEDFC